MISKCKSKGNLLLRHRMNIVVHDIFGPVLEGNRLILSGDDPAEHSIVTVLSNCHPFIIFNTEYVIIGLNAIRTEGLIPFTLLHTSIIIEDGVFCHFLLRG